MDIDLLSKMVKELILDNDKVVLPSLGSFVAEVVPSTFSDKGYTINPPYRKLYFRAKPDQGDALALFYAKSNNIQEDVAQKIISDFISELKAVLFERKTVVFPGLGRLRATKENAVFFVADEDLDIYPAGIGLEPISLKTHQETEQEVSEAVVGLRSILDEAPAAVQTEPETKPEPVIAPEPEPVLESEPVLEPESVLEPEPEADPALVAEPEMEIQVVPEIELLPEVKSDPETEGKKPFWKLFLLIAGIVMAALLVLLVAYVVLAHLAPDFMDSILYTPEELEILNRTL